eukprot:scaffold6966_cov112-Cylindrotheca_fusiformis.AAC.30
MPKRKAATPVPATPSPSKRRTKEAAQARYQKLIKAAITAQQMGFNGRKSDFLIHYGPFFGLDKSDLNEFGVATYAILPMWQTYVKQFQAIQRADPKVTQMEFCREYIQGSSNASTKSRQLSMALRAQDVLKSVGKRKLPKPTFYQPTDKYAESTKTTTPTRTNEIKEDNSSSSTSDENMVQSSEPPETPKSSPTAGAATTITSPTSIVKKGTPSEDLFSSIWGFVKKTLAPWQLEEESD